MKLFKGICVVVIAAFFLSNIDRDSDDRLAAASEEVVQISNHHECEAAIEAREAENLLLRQELEEAQQSCRLTLRVEMEFIPGLFGEWAVMTFHSVPIEISAGAAEGLSVGDNLCADSGSVAVQCRIIVADIAPIQ